jgi:parallel beta-helix repeat protein
MSRNGWFQAVTRRRRSPKRARTLNFVPRLEALEDRTLLATLIVSPGGIVPGSFSSVQAAVNAANAAGGDTILVDPGTYTEQVTIAKSLTMTGNGAGAIIQAPASLTTILGQTPLVEIGSGATVDMSSLTLTGPGPSAGIYVVGGATANVTGTTITSMRQNPLNGVQTGRGILVGSTGQSQVGHAVITNCTITDYQKSGIVTGGTGTTVTITGNTITGVGPTPLIAQNGIQITDGTTAQVSNNTVTGNQFTGASSGADPTANVQSIGILMLGSGAVAGNTVSGNDVGIANNGAGNTITGNTVQSNNFEGILLAAGSATVSNNTIAANNIGVAVVAVAGDTANAQGTIISNNISNNGNGGLVFPGGGIRLLVGPGATTTALATANFNRIVGNSVGLDNTTAAIVDAINNWWGSNAGPGGAGSDTVSGPVNFSPWLVLQVSASPSSVPPGGMATVVADLTTNSNGTNTSALGHVPDGIPVSFAAALGAINPSTSVTRLGMAFATFTAGAVPGSATVLATVDNQTSSAIIIVLAVTPSPLSKRIFLASLLDPPADPPAVPDLTSAVSFVTNLYSALLHRPPEAAGAAGWVSALEGGMPRQTVVQEIWNSPEHLAMEVNQLYLQILHRAADPAGEAGWVQYLLQGHGVNDLEAQLLDSAEYQAAHASSAAFLQGLYADVLQRNPGAAESAAWLQALQSGMNRSAIAQAFVNSSEAITNAINTDYTQFLLRPADLPGLSGWLAAEQSGALTLDQVSEAILASDEFFARA